MEAERRSQKFVVEVTTDPSTGRIVEERWRDEHGRLDRPADLPAWVQYSPETGEPVWLRWFREGLEHRDGDRPADVVMRSGITVAESYSILGRLHRDDDKPAIIYRDDKGRTRERQYINFGVWHREHGPARERISVASGKLLSGEYWVRGVRCPDPNLPKLEPM